MAKPEQFPLVDLVVSTPTETSGFVFEETHLLQELKHYLPSQTPLKDFIHHNSLHAFQKQKFFDAIFTASEIMGFQVTLQLADYRQLDKDGRIKSHALDAAILKYCNTDSPETWRKKLLTQDYDESRTPRIGRLREQWKNHYKIDLDSLVHPLLFRVLCSYLDQGIALWKFPISEKGFLDSIRQLEEKSFISFFKSKRVKELLLKGNIQINELLDILVGKEVYFEQYIFDQQFAHRGWSGMVAALESHPESLLDKRTISLKDLLVFELLLEIDALDDLLGKKWKPLSTFSREKPVNLFEKVRPNELHQVFMIWQVAFEWTYYDEVLAGLSSVDKDAEEKNKSKSFQALFCIDERECSLRRHIEKIDDLCETFGTPGFFGVEFYFQPHQGKFYEKLCPAPVTPKYLIKELPFKKEIKHEFLYHPSSASFGIGSLMSFFGAILAIPKLVQQLFNPKMSPAISNAFAHQRKDAELTVENSNTAETENDLQIGFTVKEMTNRVEALLRGIGLIENFAPLIYVIAHGSSSANNPHHGAHDCGACSGRPGSVNAKVFSIMANHDKVRNELALRGVNIPAETQFVGALHDTAADEIEYYITSTLTAENKNAHQANCKNIETALDLNAKERSRRFASIPTKAPLRKIRNAIKQRSVSMFEPRPELGHGTNTLCIVGPRKLTKKLFLDRRAFLNSYDYKNDLEGKLLSGIMKPLGPVCGGINLEYYFSRVDNYRLGAGTKLPHNVMGLVGVANSCDGDLRPGLPLQMIEVHDPVRLLIIVEHFPQVILNTIQAVPEMYQWFANEWVHLIAIHPESRDFYFFMNDSFHHYKTNSSDAIRFEDLNKLFETTKEMESNYIVDATKENLPVYALK